MSPPDYQALPPLNRSITFCQRGITIRKPANPLFRKETIGIRSTLPLQDRAVGKHAGSHNGRQTRGYFQMDFDEQDRLQASKTILQDRQQKGSGPTLLNCVTQPRHSTASEKMATLITVSIVSRGKSHHLVVRPRLTTLQALSSITHSDGGILVLL